MDIEVGRFNVAFGAADAPVLRYDPGNIWTGGALLPRGGAISSPAVTTGTVRRPAAMPLDGPASVQGDVARWVNALMLIALPIPVPAGSDVSTLVNSTVSVGSLASRPPRFGPRAAIGSFRLKDDVPEVGHGPATRLGGTQAVDRALDILDALAERPMMLAELAARVSLSSTTCYRLATALAARGLLSTAGRSGYSLGDRVGELAAALATQRNPPGAA